LTKGGGGMMQNSTGAVISGDEHGRSQQRHHRRNIKYGIGHWFESRRLAAMNSASAAGVQHGVYRRRQKNMN
jgi:hypothetical protein